MEINNYTRTPNAGVTASDPAPHRVAARGGVEDRRWVARHHSRLVFRGCDSRVRFRAASIASAGSLLPRFWLHSLCASRQLLRSYGLPPRLTGSISSTSGDSGNPCLSFTSTSSPQSQQFVSSLSTCALSLFLFVLLVLRGSLTSSPSVRGELCLLLCCTSLCTVCVLLVQSAWCVVRGVWVGPWRSGCGCDPVPLPGEAHPWACCWWGAPWVLACGPGVSDSGCPAGRMTKAHHVL